MLFRSIEAYNKEIRYPKILEEELKNNEDDEDMEKLFNLYDITGNDDDFISNEDLREDIKEIKLVFSLKKCKLLLKTKGIKDGRNKEATKRGLVGLKRKNI